LKLLSTTQDSARLAAHEVRNFRRRPVIRIFFGRCTMGVGFGRHNVSATTRGHVGSFPHLCTLGPHNVHHTDGLLRWRWYLPAMRKSVPRRTRTAVMPTTSIGCRQREQTTAHSICFERIRFTTSISYDERGLRLRRMMGFATFVRVRIVIDALCCFWDSSVKMLK
jgi:hypothetical protein